MTGPLAILERMGVKTEERREKKKNKSPRASTNKIHRTTRMTSPRCFQSHQ